MRRLVLGVTAALVAWPALAQGPKPFTLRCTFKGQPVIELRVSGTNADGSARVGTAPPVALPWALSAGTGLPGRVYAFSYNGRRYAVNSPSSFEDAGAAHLTLWNTEQGWRAPNAAYEEFRGRCRETR